jgi:uncharacterized protein (DUF433 family)
MMVDLLADRATYDLRPVDSATHGPKSRTAEPLLPAVPKAWSMRFERIAVDHRIMGGVPCVAGTRIPVATVVSLIAEGSSEIDVVAAYPQLVVADVREALRYAAEAVRERELPLRAGA